MTSTSLSATLPSLSPALFVIPVAKVFPYSMTPRPAAIALRESYGDRKLPDISRKITACVNCRKLKIKCHMTQSKPPCTRCKSHNTPCVVNKSLQTLLESDATWKEDMEQRLAKLEHALLSSQESGSQLSTTILSQNPLHDPRKQFRRSTWTQNHQGDLDESGTTLDLSCSLGAFPASSIANLSPGNDSDMTPSWPDLISRGVIPLQRAKEHLNFFKQHLNPFIHHGLDESLMIADVRGRSPLLTTAICTVSAFCTSGDEYNACLAVLKEEVGRRLFAEKNSFDDVLALCIGAFWLREVSATLHGLAVRMASQLDLHRCITKMPHKDPACYRRTRLYYLVFLCDHHCSLLYGKPSMTHEWRTLKHPATLLRSEFSTPHDLFLICQIELWAINRRVFETFGADVKSSAASRSNTEMDRLHEAYTEWHRNWMRALGGQSDLSASSTHRYLTDFCYHSGRLFLLSHVFRGRQLYEAAGTVFIDLPNRSIHDAFDAALSVVKCVTDWQEASQWLLKLPSYFSTMIAFASVCLVRLLFQPHHAPGITQSHVHDQIRRLIEILRNIGTSRQNLHSFANTLDGALIEREEPTTAFDAPVMTTDLPSDFDWDAFLNESINSNLLGDDMGWMFLGNEDHMPCQ